MSIWHKSKTKGSARFQIGIKEVRDGILVMPYNRYRLVLTTSSVNFELQSEQEQDTLVATYQAFLNSLTIPIQILVRVRELDVDRYLDDLYATHADEDQTIYKKQLENYSNFIRNLVAGNKILSRRFYIVIPHENKIKASFDIVKEQLHFEKEVIQKGLEKLGMSSRALSSLEILDLFYSFYKPEQAKIQPLVKELIRKTDEVPYY